MTMPKERKILLIAGAVLLLLGAVYRFYPTFGDFFGGTSEVALQARHVERYRQAAAQRQELQARNTDLSNQLDRAQQILLSAPTTALAAVDIQNAINEIAFANGLVLDSVRVQRPKEAAVEGYLEVPVTVTLKLRIRQLVDLLHRIESATQLLAVTDMNLRALPSGDPDSLNAVITISGYMRNPEPPARPRAATPAPARRRDNRQGT
jgi:Tfp pilus assembly protein PilO